MSNNQDGTRTERFYYWYLPIIVLVPLILMYFSGVRWMVEIVCPSINWEFGVIENLQLLILLYMTVISVIAVKRKTQMLEKVAFAFLIVFSVLVFLEEMDWGAHYYQLYTGERKSMFSELTGRINMHNQGESTAKWFKRPVYLVMASLFIILPLYKEKFTNPFLLFLTPKRLIIGTVIIAILSDLIPRFTVLLNIRPDGGLGTNIGEFSECMVYYTFALYVRELVFEKSLILERSEKVSV